ncbi:translation initiation factor IF-2-like [Vidua chalybeata]|uniref:translation initiation factor IF-2-like n=1 Tax=Vidua chalybeata TaxID=81927 RepID=UPI0023A8955D|nr:translation initiation factor IF-2-like [Vidua chalybeata]
MCRPRPAAPPLLGPAPAPPSRGHAGAPRSHRAPCPPEGAVRVPGPPDGSAPAPGTAAIPHPAAPARGRPGPGTDPGPDGASIRPTGERRHRPGLPADPGGARPRSRPRRSAPWPRCPSHLCRAPACPGALARDPARPLRAPARGLLPAGTARSPQRRGRAATVAGGAGAEPRLGLPGGPGRCRRSPVGRIAVWARASAGDPGTVPLRMRGAGAVPGPGRTAAAVFPGCPRCSGSQSGRCLSLHVPALGGPTSTPGLGGGPDRAVGPRSAFSVSCPSCLRNLGSFEQRLFPCHQ